MQFLFLYLKYWNNKMHANKITIWRIVFFFFTQFLGQFSFGQPTSLVKSNHLAFNKANHTWEKVFLWYNCLNGNVPNSKRFNQELIWQLKSQTHSFVCVWPWSSFLGRAMRTVFECFLLGRLDSTAFWIIFQ